jgi:DNA polymerase/3'-5' exonuclease PolX
MNITQAQTIADRVKAELSPHCERIEIAGSVRRQKPDVKDIEIVMIPKPYDVGLFASGIATVIEQWPKVKGDLPCKYTQRILPEGIKLDIFIAQEVNWGWILALRTGSSDYNIAVLLPRLKQHGYTAKDGLIYDQEGSLVRVYEEAHIFEMCGLGYVSPHLRNYNKSLS